MEANGRAEEVDAMSTDQTNAYIERIARILELSGYPEAAEIVRQQKI